MRGIETERKHRRWEIWHGAALPLMKRFPRFETFVDRINAADMPPMTSDQIQKAMARWAGKAAITRTYPADKSGG